MWPSSFSNNPFFDFVHCILIILFMPGNIFFKLTVNLFSHRPFQLFYRFKMLKYCTSLVHSLHFLISWLSITLTAPMAPLSSLQTLHRSPGWVSEHPSYLFLWLLPKLFWTGTTWLAVPEVLESQWLRNLNIKSICALRGTQTEDILHPVC